MNAINDNGVSSLYTVRVVRVVRRFRNAHRGQEALAGALIAGFAEVLVEAGRPHPVMLRGLIKVAEGVAEVYEGAVAATKVYAAALPGVAAAIRREKDAAGFLSAESWNGVAVEVVGSIKDKT